MLVNWPAAVSVLRDMTCEYSQGSKEVVSSPVILDVWALTGTPMVEGVIVDCSLGLDFVVDWVAVVGAQVGRGVVSNPADVDSSWLETEAVDGAVKIGVNSGIEDQVWDSSIVM